ncbi:MAG: hypothetical protein HQK57_15955 [Deltaproteobacteria bacterium]|nr:hypothetical protein [Deltaproteobacteria bacterium]
MAKQKKTWVYSPPRAKKPIPSDLVKSEIQAKADRLVEDILKPQHIKPAPEDKELNYIVDIYTKWYRGYFYFCAKYCVSSPNAVVPYFEAKFARMEYVGPDSFNLAYMRHTEQWFEIYEGLTIDKCLSLIQTDSAFIP